jgi:hypothetical protein
MLGFYPISADAISGEGITLQTVYIVGSGGFVIGGSAILSPPPIPEMVLACSIGSSNIIAFIQYPSVNVSVKVASIQAVVTSSDMECDVEDGAIILQLAA